MWRYLKNLLYEPNYPKTRVFLNFSVLITYALREPLTLHKIIMCEVKILFLVSNWAYIQKEIAIRDGKMKIGQKWFYKHEPVIIQRRDGQKENAKIIAITDTGKRNKQSP